MKDSPNGSGLKCHTPPKHTPRFYRLPPPRPRPRPPRPRPADAARDASVTAFLGASSTKRASRLRLSGKIQDLMVDPRSDKVAYDTGFFPRLAEAGKNESGERKRVRRGETVVASNASCRIGYRNAKTDHSQHEQFIWSSNTLSQS